MSAPDKPSLYWKWQTSDLRYAFICLAGGIASYHLLHFIYGLPYIKDGHWAQECVVTGLGFGVGMIVNLLLHESAHAGTARLINCPVYLLEIGTGRTIGTFRYFGFPWKLRSFPFSGIVRWEPTSLKWGKIQMLCVTSAGPIVTLFALVTVFLILNTFELSTDIANSLRWVLAFWAGIMGSTLMMMFGSWFPFDFKRDGKTIPTDALRFLRLIWTSEETIREQVQIALTMKSVRELLDEDIKTVDQALEFVAQKPRNLKALVMASQKLAVVGDKKALEFARATLCLPDTPSDKRKILLDLYLTIALDFGCLATEPNGRQLLQECLDFDPVGIGNRATYAAGLIDLGHDEEGSKILHELVGKTKTPLNAAYIHLFLAILKRKSGNIDAARIHAEKAAKLFPQLPGLKRVSELLPASSAVNKSPGADLSAVTASNLSPPHGNSKFR